MNTDQKLSKLDEFLHDISREPNAGLGGEAGYYVFSYDPKDEMRVRQWTKDEIKLLQQAHRPVVEFDLYKIIDETRQFDEVRFNIFGKQILCTFK